MAAIERRQARIDCIHMNCIALRIEDLIPNKSDEHHIIGRSQSFPEELTRFVQTNLWDPATRVSSCPTSHLSELTETGLELPS